MGRTAITAAAVTIGMAAAQLVQPTVAMAQSAGQPANTAEAFESWPPLRSTFPSTGGGGITIKGYDPVITGKTCITTFMAVEGGTTDGQATAGQQPAAPKVYANVVEFDAISVQGGTLCQNGRWRAMEGGATGTTPFRVFFKDGIIRAAP